VCVLDLTVYLRSQVPTAAAAEFKAFFPAQL